MHERCLSDVLAAVAEPTPAPAGGSSTGWACALAAALVEMSAEITVRREGDPRMGEIAARARSARGRALELAEAELSSYAPALEALRLPDEDPERAGRLDAALSAAADTPLELCRLAEAVTALAHETTRGARPSVRPDARTGLLLAEAACQAAAGLVAENLAGVPDDPRVAEAQRLAREAAAARASVAD